MEKLTTEKLVVDINQVIPNQWNPNSMSEFIYGRMKKTIEDKGLFGSIICRRNAGYYQILDGEHRWKACKELGYKQIPIEVSVKDLSDEEVKFWTLYFNNTKGKDDVEKVAKILNEIDGGQAQLLPFTDEEIKNTKDLFAFDFSQYETSKGDVAEDIMAQVLSFKFTDEEWIPVQEALNRAKDDGYVPKQWFMIMLQKYLREQGVLSGFTSLVK